MAITERYVSVAGGGAHDGTSEANAFTWAEMITDINTPRVGYRYNVKVGTYSLSATSTFTGDGTTTSPNIIRGYTTTIGDALRGRLAGGELDDSLMPSIEYASTFFLSIGSADYLHILGLKISGTRAGALVNATGANQLVAKNIVTNNSTSASAIGILINTTGLAVDNDVLLPSSVSGAIGVDNQGTALFNRVVMGSAGTSVKANNNSVRPTAFNICIGGDTGISKSAVASEFNCFNNTIYGCSGDGIDIVTSSTAMCQIYNNLIVDCGGYGIDFNTSTCVKLLFNNRFRDCASGNYNGDGDYGTAGKHGDVTTDTGGPETDFVDYAGGNFSLLSGSPGNNTATGYLLNIGANGTLGGGGGPLINGRLVQ